MVYGTGTVSIRLGSDFNSGQEYVVLVNDVEERFTAQ